MLQRSVLGSAVVALIAVGACGEEEDFPQKPVEGAGTDSDSETGSGDGEDGDTGDSDMPDGDGEVPDHIVWIEIPGGTFEMGSTVGGGGEESSEVTVPDFEITKTEITAAQIDGP
jgi:formylglycine-generating enzyme required for sulfatase activity